MANKITETIHILHKEEKKKSYKILANIPTRNGYHIVTNPFNRTRFKEILPDVKYEDNSPTLLYI